MRRFGDPLPAHQKEEVVLVYVLTRDKGLTSPRGLAEKNPFVASTVKDYSFMLDFPARFWRAPGNHPDLYRNADPDIVSFLLYSMSEPNKQTLPTSNL
jgi:hypothetical protein